MIITMFIFLDDSGDKKIGEPPRKIYIVWLDNLHKGFRVPVTCVSGDINSSQTLIGALP